tara:strand:+ start:64 stop:543 length:480 start_codon:yes stop_codon:yes gene_type:complete
MLRIKDLKIYFLLLGFIINFSLFTPKVLAGSFGAEIFCTMRQAGNDHESSWEAAYSYIKRQKGGFFKTSPKQAATQLVETVVREKDKFSDCVKYLDRLYPDRELQKKLKKDELEKKREANEKENRRKKIEALLEQDNEGISEEPLNGYNYEESFDRYDY